jgi:transporter family-2 protein
VAILFSILAGIFTTLETSINSQLGKYLTPSIATLHSLAVGMVFMLTVSLTRGSLTRYYKVFSVSPVWLIGGFFGAMIIYLSSKAIPVLGVSKALTLILAGQLISGLLIDLFVNNIDISWAKVGGLALFLIGAYQIVK